MGGVIFLPQIAQRKEEEAQCEDCDEREWEKCHLRLGGAAVQWRRARAQRREVADANDVFLSSVRAHQGRRPSHA